MVKVVVNCKQDVLSISIEPEVVDPEDKEMLEDLVTAAVNQALRESQNKANEEMKNLSGGLLGGLNLPGNFKLPGM